MLPALRRRNRQRLSVVLFGLLLATHLDAWRPQREVLWLGWLPEELAWRLLWMLGAAAFVVWFTRAVWAQEGTREGAHGATHEDREPRR
jgi:hypothetical protein